MNQGRVNQKQAQLGTNAEPKTGSWVQVDRAAHEQWGMLCAKHASAASLLHHIIARMGHQNALVASQATLAAMMGASLSTAKRAIAVLKAGRWIQVVNVGTGGTHAYVVNDRVAWGEARGMMQHVSIFSATVVASAGDQDVATLEDTTPLRRIPVIYPGERQLPAGPGSEPPAQAQLIDHDMPALSGDAADRDALEARGQSRLVE